MFKTKPRDLHPALSQLCTGPFLCSAPLSGESLPRPQVAGPERWRRADVTPRRPAPVPAGVVQSRLAGAILFNGRLLTSLALFTCFFFCFFLYFDSFTFTISYTAAPNSPFLNPYGPLCRRRASGHGDNRYRMSRVLIMHATTQVCSTAGPGCWW